MRITNISTPYLYKSITMKSSNIQKKSTGTTTETDSRFSQASKKELIFPARKTMRNVNIENKDVFEVFDKIDEATRNINFVKSQEAWNDCLLEEIEEFNVARDEYKKNPTPQNYDHMEEEMGDIFYTTASISKDSGINPKKAFRATNLKFYNRVNLMENILISSTKNPNADLGNLRDYERRALWNAAKRKLYDAQAMQYKEN